MLSPGKLHEAIPRDVEGNVAWRALVLEACRTDRAMRAAIMEVCRNDCLFWINTFVWQFNPELMEEGPFITWPYQEVAIVGGYTDIGGEKVFQHGILACVEDRKDCRWPKSREGGASWIALMTIAWLCMFKNNIKALALSRHEKAVDKIDDSDSLFEKVRFILDCIPEWMKGEIRSKKSSIKFPTGSTFTGEANVASAGVGGRASIMLIDEFGQFDKNGEEIYDFTTDTSHCRLFVYTHKDQSGMAYRLSYDAKYTHMREIMTHWSQHPHKNKGLYKYNENTNRAEYLWPDGKWKAQPHYAYPPDFEPVLEARPTGGPCPGIRSPWYDVEDKRRSDRDRSMNLDIDPRGASDKPFDSHRIHILKMEWCIPPIWVGDLIYDKKTAAPKRLVMNPKGLLRLWVWPTSDTELPRMRAGAAVDVAAGSGASPSCLSVGDALAGRKVAEYSNANIYANEFAEFVVAFLRTIKDPSGIHPLLCWELQGSSAFQRRVREELLYFPVYIKREEDKLGRPRDNAGRAGFNVTPKAVMTLIETYRAALYDQSFINPSEESLDETLNLVYSDTSIVYRHKGKKEMTGSGATVHHGDMTRADALLLMMLKELGLESPEVNRQIIKYPDPRTSGYREWLAEQEGQEELVWA